MPPTALGRPPGQRGRKPGRRKTKLATPWGPKGPTQPTAKGLEPIKIPKKRGPKPGSRVGRRGAGRLGAGGGVRVREKKTGRGEKERER